MRVTPKFKILKRFSWPLTILWSILTAILFLTPSGDGTPVTFMSELFGGTTITDAIGHVIINSLLSLLWYWSLTKNIQNPRKLIIWIGIVWAVSAELLQLFIPGRGGSLLDMIANSIGIFVGIWFYSALRKRLSQTEPPHHV